MRYGRGDLETDGGEARHRETLGRGTEALQHAVAVKGIGGRGVLVGGDHVHAVPHTVLGVIGERRRCEAVREPGPGGVRGRAHSHDHAVATAGEFAHHPAIGDSIVQHDGVTCTTVTGDTPDGVHEVVQIDLRTQGVAALVVDAEVGSRRAVDHLDHVVRSNVQAGVGRVHIRVADAVDGDVQITIAGTCALAFALLPYRVGALRQGLGIHGLVQAIGLVAGRPVLVHQQTFRIADHWIFEGPGRIPVAVGNGLPEEDHLLHFGIAELNVVLGVEGRG